MNERESLKKQLVAEYSSRIIRLVTDRGSYYTRTEGAYDIDSETFLFFRREKRYSDAQGLHDLLEVCRRTTSLYLAQKNGAAPTEEELAERIRTSLQAI